MVGDELPDMFDRLAAHVDRWSEEYGEFPEFRLSSDRVVVASDAGERVRVCIKDFVVDSIRVDPLWWEQADPGVEEVESVVCEAVNAGLSRYWAEELEAARQASTPMGELADTLMCLSGEFRSAYQKAVERLEAHW